MTLFNLRTVRLRPSERYERRLPVQLEPFALGGERYEPAPEDPEARFSISRATTGSLFGLAFEVALIGPCVRCLDEASVRLAVDATEYQATNPESEEVRTPYVVDDRLDLSAWARDAVALALPEKILCREDCAGLCAGCGANLNEEECRCAPAAPDPRFAKLAELRDRLTAVERADSGGG